MEVTIRFKSRTLAFLLRPWVRPARPRPVEADHFDLPPMPETITTPLRRVKPVEPAPIARSPQAASHEESKARKMPEPIAPEPAAGRLSTLRLNAPPEPGPFTPPAAFPPAPPLRPTPVLEPPPARVLQAAAEPEEEQETHGWWPSLAYASPLTVWVSGVLVSLLLGATAMVATVETLPVAARSLKMVGGAIRQSVDFARAEPAEAEPPRPPAALFPYGKVPEPEGRPSPTPRILGIRTDPCVADVPDPGLDPWNARLFSASKGDSGMVAPAKDSGCFGSAAATPSGR